MHKRTKLTLKGLTRFNIGIVYSSILTIAMLYKAYILNEDFNLKAFYFLFALYGGIWLIDIFIRFLGKDFLFSIRLDENTLSGRRYMSLRKFHLNIDSITDVKLRKSPLANPWFGSRYSIYYLEKGISRHIDVLTSEFLKGIDDLIESLLQSERCPVLKVEQITLSKKQL